MYRFFCGLINIYFINKVITLSGWIYRIRNYGSLIFVDLKDKTGYVQLILIKKLCYFYFNFIKLGSCVKIIGIPIYKKFFYFNKFNSTGNLEIICLIFININISKSLMFKIDDFNNSDIIRFKNRFLDLRRIFMQNNLNMRFNIIKYIKSFLNKELFIEIETPLLTKSTPEGSRDFLVPSRLNPGFFFALPQSPQIFKQIFMIAGFDRYYQIVKCFRDEDLRSNRQPEFTQLDCELSFFNNIDIRFLFEKLIFFIILKILNYSFFTKFLILDYFNSIRYLLTDKPDLRFKSVYINFYYFYKFFFYKKNYKKKFFICIKLFNGLNLFGNNFKNFKIFLNLYFLDKNFFFINLIFIIII